MKPHRVQHVVPRHRGIKTRGQVSFDRGALSHATITSVFGILALVLVGTLGFFYLQQVVNTASQGTDVHQLESSIIELRERQRELELEGAQLRSLQTVEERIEKLNLVTTDQVSYLAPTRSRVAADL